MNNDILGKCPVCNASTEIAKIKCNSCNTIIEGRFLPCKFCRLSSEQKIFIDVFIKCKGNIKEVEKELGISYPTVKNKLEDVSSSLGHTVNFDTDKDSSKRKEILNSLNQGKISVEEALSMLKSF